MLHALHAAFHDPRTRVFHVVQGVVWGLIVFSIAVFALEMVLGEAHPAWPWLLAVDKVVLAIFAVEITLRVVSFRPPSLDLFELGPLARIRVHLLGRLRFLLRPLNLVDLLTVTALLPVLRGLRAVRLLRMVRAFRYSNPFLAVRRVFEENSLLYGFAFSLLGTATLVGGASIYLVERGANPDVRSMADGLWWAIVTLTTVGFGDITPVTALGRLLGSLLMVTGMFTLALFAGIVGHTVLFAVLGLREEQFRMSDQANHVVICGYDTGARMLLDVLLKEVNPDTTPIVIIADADRPREIPLGIAWVRGDPTKESELDKLRLGYAAAAIIVGSRAVPPQQADAVTLLTAFTLRSHLARLRVHEKRKRPLYIVAEILDSENVDHARTAGADEVIETTHLGFSLMSHAVRVPGTAAILSEMAVAGAQDMFVGRIPACVEGPVAFADLVERVKRDRGALVLGLRDPETGRDRLNPPAETLVQPHDLLIYLADRAVLANHTGAPVDEG